MNTTKTMRLPPRRLITTPGPSIGPNTRPNKRKQRDGEAHQLSLLAKLSTPLSPSLPPPQNQQLLAGYLAHEFFTKGTLFGQAWDHSVTASEAEPTEKLRAEPNVKDYQSYVEVANLFKHGGAHFEGIVNPTQLAGLLNL